MSKKEIKKIESFQWKAMGMVLELKGLEFEKRLKRSSYLELKRKGGFDPNIQGIHGLEGIDLWMNMGREL